MYYYLIRQIYQKKERKRGIFPNSAQRMEFRQFKVTNQQFFPVSPMAARDQDLQPSCSAFPSHKQGDGLKME